MHGARLRQRHAGAQAEPLGGGVDARRALRHCRACRRRPADRQAADFSARRGRSRAGKATGSESVARTKPHSCPLQHPGTKRTAAVAHEARGKAGRSDAVRRRRRRRGPTIQRVAAAEGSSPRRGAQQQGERAAAPAWPAASESRRVATRSAPPRISPITAPTRAAAQRLFHHPEHVARFRRRHRQQFFRRQAERVEAGTMRRAAFAQRHVFGDPQRRLALPRRQREGKAGRRRHVALARRGDLVQGAAGQARRPAPHRRRRCRRETAGIARPGRLGGADRLAQRHDLRS